MSLVNLGLANFFDGDDAGQARWRKLSGHLKRRLSTASASLDRLGLCFEADAAEDLAEKFGSFIEQDGSPEDFGTLWCELEDFCGQEVTSGGRSKTLYNLPQLPDDFGC